MKTMRSVLLDILVAALMLAAFLVPFIPFMASADEVQTAYDSIAAYTDAAGSFIEITLFTPPDSDPEDFFLMVGFISDEGVEYTYTQGSFVIDPPNSIGAFNDVNINDFKCDIPFSVVNEEYNADFTVTVFCDGSYSIQNNDNVVEMPNFLGSTTPASIIASVRQGTQETSDQLPFALAGTGIAFSIGGGLLWFLARFIK